MPGNTQTQQHRQHCASATADNCDGAPIAVFGPVCAIRAVASRQVSVISIEVPECVHVRVTNLLYGRNALVHRPVLTGTPGSYGLVDGLAESAAADTPVSTSEVSDSRFVFGYVCDVRAFRSRDITTISIEVPEEAHVEVTQMLYGQDVFVIPSTLASATPYGVVSRPGTTVHHPNPLANKVSCSAPPPLSQAGTNAAPPHTRWSSLIRRPRELNIVQWVGIRCANPQFQAFLGVNNEREAANEVRRRCVIDSRSSLATDMAAQQRFMRQIYHPFINQQRSGEFN